jgi:hypothetical protein
MMAPDRFGAKLADPHQPVTVAGAETSPVPPVLRVKKQALLPRHLDQDACLLSH